LDFLTSRAGVLPTSQIIRGGELLVPIAGLAAGRVARGLQFLLTAAKIISSINRIHAGVKAVIAPHFSTYCYAHDSSGLGGRSAGNWGSPGSATRAGVSLGQGSENGLGSDGGSPAGSSKGASSGLVCWAMAIAPAIAD